MKKIYKLENLDCANCSAKMEDDIKKIPGIIHASVNFIRQTLTIEANENIFEEVVNKAVKVCKKIEPDCCILR